MKYFPILLFVLLSFKSKGQSMQNSLPLKVDPAGRYLFYLHGRIVEEQGIHAVHPQLGEYRYLEILDSLKKYFYVISEARPCDTDVLQYAEKVALQIDSLRRKGIPVEHMFVFGASKGAYITLWIAEKLKTENLNFVVMGVCSEETDSNFRGKELCGNFLSFYESSDPWASSCMGLLKDESCIAGFKEVRLTTGKAHGFLYSPSSQWLNPLVEWADRIISN